MNSITIIIATYNAEKYLQDCIDSLIFQNDMPIELIIIDGESKDSTVDIIIKNQKYISYWTSESDKGIYDAWNKGINAAKGDWIMFIGADDLLLPDALKHYSSILDETEDVQNYDYICAYNQYVDIKGKLIKVFGEDAIWKGMKKKMSAAHVASLHNKRLFNEVGEYNTKYKICADYELLLRKGSNLNSLFIPFKIACMKVGGASFSSKAILETYEIRKEHRTVSKMANRMLLLKNYCEFYFFIFRKSLLGYKLS